MVAFEDMDVTYEEEMVVQAEEFLKTLSSRFNLPELSFDDGACILNFGRGNVLTLYPQLDGLRSIIMHVMVGVAPLSGPNSTKLMLEFLNGNDAWSLTQGATLGMDKTDGSVSLWQRFTLPAVTEDEIVDAVEVLLSTAEYWRTFLKENGGEPAFLDDSGPAGAKDVPPGSGPHVFMA